MEKKINISMILMAYNEQDNIAKAIDDLHAVAKKIADKFEIIVSYAEASTDNTERTIKEKMQSCPELNIVYRPRERSGYGYGLRLGIENAKYEYIFYTDGDNQFDPNEIELLLPFINNHGIVTGVRKSRQDPLARKIYSLGYNIFIDLLFFRAFTDVDCAFKIYRKEIFKDMKLTSDTGFLDAEILIKAKKFGIKTLPVTHLPRTKGQSCTKGSLSHKLMIVKDLLKDMLEVRFNVSR
jgi:glycosyltransferase involved in cell wall biosynthesis